MIQWWNDSAPLHRFSLRNPVGPGSASSRASSAAPSPLSRPTGWTGEHTSPNQKRASSSRRKRRESRLKPTGCREGSEGHRAAESSRGKARPTPRALPVLPGTAPITRFIDVSRAILDEKTTNSARAPWKYMDGWASIRPKPEACPQQSHAGCRVPPPREFGRSERGTGTTRRGARTGNQEDGICGPQGRVRSAGRRREGSLPLRCRCRSSQLR